MKEILRKFRFIYAVTLLSILALVTVGNLFFPLFLVNMTQNNMWLFLYVVEPLLVIECGFAGALVKIYKEGVDNASKT